MLILWCLEEELLTCYKLGHLLLYCHGLEIFNVDSWLLMCLFGELLCQLLLYSSLAMVKDLGENLDHLFSNPFSFKRIDGWRQSFG